MSRLVEPQNPLARALSCSLSRGARKLPAGSGLEPVATAFAVHVKLGQGSGWAVIDTFRALLLEETNGRTTASVRELRRDQLPEGDVVVSVVYSSLNYKDGMAILGKGKIVRTFPFVPGIDLAGTVVESSSASYKPGDPVILTGWGVGERHWGGFAQLARVRSEWLTPLPAGMSLKHAMGFGTAGFTAMLCVMALERAGMAPGSAVVVTGAGGGVGSVAVALLSRLGYRVVASTGRPELHDYLRGLGASEILDRRVLAEPSTRPLESERWGGAVDTVGGTTLTGLLRAMAYGTSVAVCGLAGGPELSTTVYPFILRGVNILGVDSVRFPAEKRPAVWQRLAQTVPAEVLDQMIQVIPLEELPQAADDILAGRIRGRVVVDPNL